MFTSSLNRLIWKDFRAIGPVWIALFAAVVMLQLILVAAAWLDPASWRWDGRGALWGTLATVCMPLGFCLAAAAAGILFAGESEEQTDEWLRVLPIRPRTLAVAKLGTGLGALLTFVGAGLATASLWTWIGGSFMRWTATPLRADIAAVIGMILLAGLAALATGVFLSVQMRRVIAVVAGTLVGALPLFGIADWFANDVLRIPNDLGSPLLFTALGLLDVWLVVRWCRGETVFAIGLARRAALRLVSGPQDRHVEPARRRTANAVTRGSPGVLQRGVALGSLRWGATLGSPTARAFAVQTWGEARRALPFACLWTGVGAVMLLPALLSKVRAFPVDLLWMLASLYWCVTPGLCGVLAASDRRQDQQLFLGQRGVSPTLTWLAKQGVWLAVAAVLTVSWTWMQHALTTPEGTSLFRGLIDALSAPSSRGSVPRWAVAPADLALRKEFLWMLPLGLYAAGQLCGFWFCNGVVAVGLAIALSIPVAGWLYLAVAADVSPVTAVGPMVVLWLIGTWRLMDDWLVDRRSCSLLLRRMAWTLVPCLVAIMMFSVSRRTQIPWIGGAYPTAAVYRAGQHGEALRIAAMSVADTPRALPPAPEWPELKERLEQYVRASRRAEAQGAAGWASDEVQRLDNDFGAFAEQVRREGYSSNLSIRVLDINWTGAVAEFVLRRGAELRASGTSRRELQTCLDGLAVLRLVREIPPLDDQICLQQRVRLFARIADWARRPETSADDLQAARRSADFRQESEFIHWLPPAAYVASMEDLFHVLFVEQPELLAKARAEVAPESAVSILKMLLTVDRWMGEQARAQRFLRASRVKTDSIAVWDWKPAPTLYGTVAMSRLDLERWAATTGPLRWVNPPRLVPFAEQVLGIVQGLALQGQTELACERGLRLVLALELFRRDEGRYPERLSQLVPQYLAELPDDPFTGAEFVYVPQGLDAPWLLDARSVFLPSEWTRQADRSAMEEVDRLSSRLRVIPAARPLLFSRGPYSGGYVFQPYPAPLWTADAEGRRQPTGMYREVVSGAIDGGGPSGREPPALAELAAVRAEPEAPPTFFVLGMEFTPW